VGAKVIINLNKENPVLEDNAVEQVSTFSAMKDASINATPQYTLKALDPQTQNQTACLPRAKYML
jgi:hypothetical protein